jgi:hypothetical protein
MVNHPTPYSLLTGFVQSRDVFRTVAQIDQLKDAGSTASQMMKRLNRDGVWTYFSLPWHAVRVVYTEHEQPSAIAIGPDGIVSFSDAKGATEENVDEEGPDGPSRRGPIRDLKLIAGVPYAVGMSRQVYRREGADNWTHQDEGTLAPRGVMALSGLNSLDGLTESCIYAVGFNGEIWRRLNGDWQQLNSPTMSVLHTVKVVREDLIFASGQLGTLLRSDGEHWEVIEHGADVADLWGIEWFDGKLYVACDQGLFRLDEHDALQHVDMKLDPLATCRHLHSADGVLLSTGPKHMCWSEDGTLWQDVTP